MSKPRDLKKELSEYLRELHLPAVLRSFEEKARQAEPETLGYEQYLLDLVERECQEPRASHHAAVASLQAAIGKDVGQLSISNGCRRKRRAK